MRVVSLRHLAVVMVAAAPLGAVVAVEPGTPFELKASFSPSFLMKSQLIFASAGQGAQASLEIHIEVPAMERIAPVVDPRAAEFLREMVKAKTVSLPVSASVTADFLREMSGILLKPSKRELGLDGCDVTLDLRLAGREAFSSYVWSPRRQSAPAEDALLRALYKVVDHCAPTMPKPAEWYLEHLFRYMDHIQSPWKVSGGKGMPVTVRFYPNVTSDEIPAFSELVATLPKEGEPICFDITHLDTTGSLFRTGLLKAATVRRIQWRAGEVWTRQLLEGGIPKETITVVDDPFAN